MNALERTVWPSAAENTRTAPVPGDPTAAVTTICVGDAESIEAAATPHSVTFVTSPGVPAHRLMPEMVTE